MPQGCGACPGSFVQPAASALTRTESNLQRAFTRHAVEDIFGLKPNAGRKRHGGCQAESAEKKGLKFGNSVRELQHRHCRGGAFALLAAGEKYWKRPADSANSSRSAIGSNVRQYAEAAARSLLQASIPTVCGPGLEEKIDGFCRSAGERVASIAPWIALTEDPRRAA